MAPARSLMSGLRATARLRSILAGDPSNGQAVDRKGGDQRRNECSAAKHPAREIATTGIDLLKELVLAVRFIHGPTLEFSGYMPSRSSVKYWLAPPGAPCGEPPRAS